MSLKLSTRDCIQCHIAAGTLLPELISILSFYWRCRRLAAFRNEAENKSLQTSTFIPLFLRIIFLMAEINLTLRKIYICSYIETVLTTGK